MNKETSDQQPATVEAWDFNYAHYGIPYGIHYLFSQEAQLSTINASDGKPRNLW